MKLVRNLVIVLMLLTFGTAVCGGIVFILAGDQILDFVQISLARVELNNRQDDLSRGVSDDTTPVRFTVLSGETPREIARNLFNAGLIVDSELFIDYVRVNGLDTQLEAGTYFLTRAQTIPQIAEMLTDSGSSQFTFTILEGWRIEEIADSIDANSVYFGFSGQDFLAIIGPGAVVEDSFAEFVSLPNGASLEGFLYPDTYRLPATITAVQLRDILLQTFLERVGTQLPLDVREQDYTLYEIVTLASIIEREAVHDDEHILIASVYRNRLDIGMNLDADPTVQYGLMGMRDGVWWPQITQADYREVFSEYNTYLYGGLPPGPIASPGISAIRGAAYPATSNYYYFRARCDGSGYHDFAVTYEEQLANGC